MCGLADPATTRGLAPASHRAGPLPAASSSLPGTGVPAQETQGRPCFRGEGAEAGRPDVRHAGLSAQAAAEVRTEVPGKALCPAPARRDAWGASGAWAASSTPHPPCCCPAPGVGGEGRGAPGLSRLPLGGPRETCFPLSGWFGSPAPTQPARPPKEEGLLLQTGRSGAAGGRQRGSGFRAVSAPCRAESGGCRPLPPPRTPASAGLGRPRLPGRPWSGRPQAQGRRRPPPLPQ